MDEQLATSKSPELRHNLHSMHLKDESSSPIYDKYIETSHYFIEQVPLIPYDRQIMTTFLSEKPNKLNPILATSSALAHFQSRLFLSISPNLLDCQ